MKWIKHFKVPGMLCIAASLLFTPIGADAVSKAEYEALKVELPYTHRYTTTDTAVDDLFHYIIEPLEDAPVPTESGGLNFTVEGKNGTEGKGDRQTVYEGAGSIAFTFIKPGVYSYVLRADRDTDSKKENADRYTLEPRTFTISFYIENASEGSMKLQMLTVENDKGVKPNKVVLETSYKGTVKGKTNSGGGKKTTKGGSAGTKTGDESNAPFYIALILCAGVGAVVVQANKRKRGGQGDE